MKTTAAQRQAIRDILVIAQVRAAMTGQPFSVKMPDAQLLLSLLDDLDELTAVPPIAPPRLCGNGTHGWQHPGETLPALGTPCDCGKTTWSRE